MNNTDRDNPRHFQVLLMDSEMERLKKKVEEKTTMEALRIAVDFTIKHYGTV